MKKQTNFLSLCLGIALIAVAAYGLYDSNEIFVALTILPTTALQKINLMTEEAWAVNQNQIEVKTLDTASFQKQLQMQATLGQSFVRRVTDPGKDYDVDIYWTDFCNETAADCDADDYCGDLASNQAGVQKKSYPITQCIMDDFSVSESDFAGSWMDMQNFIRDNQNQKIVNLLNLLNKKYLLFLHANAGFNRGEQYTLNVTNQSEIPTSEYNNTLLITKLMLDAEKSNIRGAFALDGGNLWHTYHNAMFNAGNGEGKGDAARNRYFDITLDVRGFSKVPTVADSTFLVTPYAAAFVNKNYYKSKVPTYDATLDKDKYFINIPAFGITIDVLHQRVCESGKKDRFNHIWKYTLHYDFFSNPNGCADANGKIVTGIMEYTKVADPV